MSSIYHLVQYAPDPADGERLNVGVIVLSEEHKLIHFVENVHRLRCLAGNDAVRAFRAFAKMLPDHLTADYVKHAVDSWRGCIQITKARGSLHDAEFLLSDIARRMLVDPPLDAPGHLVKADVQTTVKQALTRNLKARFGGVGKLFLKDDYAVRIGNDRYLFDFAIANGTARHLVQSLSFQVEAVKRIETQINSAAWSIQKLRTQRSTIPVTVVAAKPQPSQTDAMDMFNQAHRTYRELDATMITNDQVETWSANVVTGLSEM